ncbi:alpha/beta fold hydrolase [Chitinophaga sp.]|uniref:thioesterase II family protein n=1 Tax=Chitinophaga sp. TaxID=1869181 RepID=UPI0031D33E66
MDKVKLFCFPYAGGSAAVFNKWHRQLLPFVELVPVELAGRGKRMQEPLYRSVDEMVDDVYRIIKDDVRKGHYALYGHSMGSMIAFELAQRIVHDNLPVPLHIFFSGRGAPGVKGKPEKNYALMTDDEFRAEVMQLGGTPREFFEYPELLEIFLPLLKNDFRLADEERYDRETKPLPCDISVFLGKDDELTPEQCDGWKKHNHTLCSVVYFEGGHFFIHDDTDQILDCINNVIQRACARRGDRQNAGLASFS